MLFLVTRNDMAVPESKKDLVMPAKHDKLTANAPDMAPADWILPTNKTPSRTIDD
jgi:hypothetical protein